MQAARSAGEVLTPAFAWLTARSSSLPRVDGSGKADAPVSYAETYSPLLHFGWSAMQSARVPEWKYISAPRSELHDLRKDPSESTNVIVRQGGAASALLTERRFDQARREIERAARLQPRSARWLAPGAGCTNGKA